MTDPQASQAPFLHSLGDHIDAHDLPAVDITSDFAGGWNLHVPGGCTAGALVAWARSGNTTTLEIRALERQVNIGFHSQLGGRAIRVWGCVDTLRDVMDLTDTTPISVEDLAYFADHGALPEREANR